MHQFDVLVIGRSCLDIISVVDRFPEENQKAPLLFRLQEGGGQGSTAACCISRLGGRVAYIGRLGDDKEGQFCLQRLKDFAVDTGDVEIIKAARTPVAYIFVTRSTGARTILYESSKLPRIESTARLENLIASTGVLLLDPETTYLAKELNRLKDANTKVVYDCERWRDGLSDMMAVADYFIPCFEFLDTAAEGSGDRSLTEKMKGLKKKIRGELIVTNGQEGAYFIEADRIYRVATPPVKAIDTIGAGDNFHATFALAVARGMSLHQSVKLAVASASMSCTEYGGRKGIPSWKEATAAAGQLTVDEMK